MLPNPPAGHGHSGNKCLGKQQLDCSCGASSVHSLSPDCSETRFFASPTRWHVPEPDELSTCELTIEGNTAVNMYHPGILQGTSFHARLRDPAHSLVRIRIENNYGQGRSWRVTSAGQSMSSSKLGGTWTAASHIPRSRWRPWLWHVSGCGSGVFTMKQHDW